MDLVAEAAAHRTAGRPAPVAVEAAE